jgi:hypothetical protein
MIKPASLRLELRQGIGWELVLESVRDPQGVALPLGSGWRADWAARRGPTAAPWITASSAGASPRITLANAAPTLVLRMPDAPMLGVALGESVHDLLLTDPSGKRWPFITGPLAVLPYAVVLP